MDEDDWSNVVKRLRGANKNELAFREGVERARFCFRWTCNFMWE